MADRNVAQHSDGKLVLYDAACRALAEAVSIDEVKDVLDKAEAIREYARRAKNKQLEIDATQIRIEAERKLGLLEIAQKETVGFNVGTAGTLRGRDASGPAFTEGPEDTRPTLADMGISYKLSSRAQKLAAIPEAEFKADLAEWRANAEKESERVTTKLVHKGQRRQQADDFAKLPKGIIPTSTRYGTIVIDPPWPMEKIERDVRPNQTGFDYPTMSEEELAEFPVPDLAEDDCHLFLWTTHKFLPMALRLADVWGFAYVCTFVWHKPGGFQPIGLPQYNCEFVLYGRLGAPKFVDTKRFPTCFNAKRREHSRKPDEFYDMIRRATDGRRIDVFSREARDGFDQYGNEAGKFLAAE